MSQRKRSPEALSADAASSSKMARSMLRNLKKDVALADASLGCCGEIFKAHRLVLCNFCPFFRSAFLGGFKESKSNHVDMEDTTPRAVAVLLNYAYALDAVEACGSDLDLAFEVWHLAARLEVEGLKTIAADATIDLAKPDNYVRIYQEWKQLSRLEYLEKTIIAIQNRFPSVSSNIFAALGLSVDELESMITSQELVGTELQLFRAIAIWVNADKEERLQNSARLLGMLSFERAGTNDLHAMLQYDEVIPRAILMSMVLAAANRCESEMKDISEYDFMEEYVPMDWAVVLHEHFVDSEGFRDRDLFLRKSQRCENASTIVFPAPKRDVLSSGDVEIPFSICGCAMRVRFTLRGAECVMHLGLDRRESAVPWAKIRDDVPSIRADVVGRRFHLRLIAVEGMKVLADRQQVIRATRLLYDPTYPETGTPIELIAVRDAWLSLGSSAQAGAETDVRSRSAKKFVMSMHTSGDHSVRLLPRMLQRSGGSAPVTNAGSPLL